MKPSLSRPLSLSLSLGPFLSLLALDSVPVLLLQLYTSSSLDSKQHTMCVPLEHVTHALYFAVSHQGGARCGERALSAMPEPVGRPFLMSFFIASCFDLVFSVVLALCLRSCPCSSLFPWSCILFFSPSVVFDFSFFLCHGRSPVLLLFILRAPRPRFSLYFFSSATRGCAPSTNSVPS